MFFLLRKRSMNLFVKFLVKCYEKSRRRVPLYYDSIPVKKTYPTMNPKLSKAFYVFADFKSPILSFTAAILCLLYTAAGHAQQAVTSIITDFNGYWKSSTSSVNTVKPNNSHNLLAFTYNGTQYSTGANNTVLANHGQTFVEGDFWSLPLASYSGSVNSNTKVGLGEMYDGVHNGKGSASYSNNIATYLNDGIKGLDLGTCVANLPAGSISFVVSNIRPENIGDGIPDIVVTQVADPSNSTDKYSFINASGNTIGQVKEVSFTSIPAVGNWTADFYEASTNPMTLSSGFTNTDRPLRLWAADLSDFGITQANYTSIRNFRISLSGNSDVAFVAYNNKTLTIVNVLPVVLTDFTARLSGNNALLNWTTASENGTDYFVPERSLDGNSFQPLDTVSAKGNSSNAQHYTCTDQQPSAGISYYRLKIVDENKKVSYSKVIPLSGPVPEVKVYPNPAADHLTVSYGAGTQNICIYNSAGRLLFQKKTDPNSYQAGFDLSSFAKGLYYLVCENGLEKTSRSFIIR